MRVAPVLLPHVRGRPLTLHRFPEGVDGPHFFQTRVPPHPEWLRTATLTFPRTGKTFEAPVVDDLAGLVWAANLSTVELHPFLATVDALDEPRLLVVDLDPGAPAGAADACRVALRARELLREAGLEPTVKASGGKGVHVSAGVAPGTTYAQTKAWCRGLARRLTADDPQGVTDLMTKALRAGRVFVDWSQNDPGKSTVAPWSARRGGTVPTVAVPLAWDEVAQVASDGDARPLVVGVGQALRRMEKYGDLSAGQLTVRRTLPAA